MDSNLTWAEIADDARMATLDEDLESLVKSHGVGGVALDEIAQKFGDLGLIRSGMLVSKGSLVVIGGGGNKDYILAIAD